MQDRPAPVLHCLTIKTGTLSHGRRHPPPAHRRFGTGLFSRDHTMGHIQPTHEGTIATAQGSF